MLKLSLGGFIAFGAGSIPAGWLGDRWSRRGMMIVFFFGIGAAAILAGLVQTPWQLAAALTLVGLFGAIYHPVGIAMLVKDETRVGRALGINGIWGNLGVAFAALAAGGLAEFAGWRAAFIVPGLAVMMLGAVFAWIIPPLDTGGGRTAVARAALDNATIVRVFAVLLVATACGGVIFNATTIAMPKVFEERLSALAQSTFGIGALVCAVYVIAAFSQYCVGRLIDKVSVRAVFVPVALMQVPLLLLAATLENWAMLIVAVAMMFFVFGQIPINDAMVARYTDEHWRARNLCGALCGVVWRQQPFRAADRAAARRVGQFCVRVHGLERDCRADRPSGAVFPAFPPDGGTGCGRIITPPGRPRRRGGIRRPRRAGCAASLRG